MLNNLLNCHIQYHSAYEVVLNTLRQCFQMTSGHNVAHCTCVFKQYV